MCRISVFTPMYTITQVISHHHRQRGVIGRMHTSCDISCLFFFFSSELLQLYVMPLPGLCTLHFNQAASYMAFTRQHWSRESIISPCFAAVATAWYVRAVFTSFILRTRPGHILLLFLPSKYNQLTVHRMNWSFKWSVEIKPKNSSLHKGPVDAL